MKMTSSTGERLGRIKSGSGNSSVANSSDGLIFGKRRALFLAKIRALDGRKDGRNSSLCIKKARKFDSRHFNEKVCKSRQFWDESSFGRNFYSTCHLIVSRWHSLVAPWFTLLNSLLML